MADIKKFHVFVFPEGCRCYVGFVACTSILLLSQAPIMSKIESKFICIQIILISALLHEDTDEWENKTCRKGSLRGKMWEDACKRGSSVFGGILLPVSVLQTCSHQMAQQHGPEHPKSSSVWYFSRNSQILLLILNLQYCFKHNIRKGEKGNFCMYFICSCLSNKAG